MIKRVIERHEVEAAILAGALIKEYPDDKYSPTCLIKRLELMDRLHGIGVVFDAETSCWIFFYLDMNAHTVIQFV